MAQPKFTLYKYIKLPVTHHDGRDRSDLDHPRDGSPEVREEFQEWIGFFFGQLVVAVLCEPRSSLSSLQSLRGSG
jgi:hypothetical protein